jgi:hypothetical protein
MFSRDELRYMTRIFQESGSAIHAPRCTTWYSVRPRIGPERAHAYDGIGAHLLLLPEFRNGVTENEYPPANSDRG